MRRIFKYEVPVDDRVHSIDLTSGPVLHVDQQYNDVGRVFFWAWNDDQDITSARQFLVVGTGHLTPSGTVYVGTVQVGPLVWHLLEIP